MGSGRTLSDDRARRMRRQIDDQSPDDLGIAAAVWSRKAVRDLIRRECGIDMPVRTVGGYLIRWDDMAKGPPRRARDQDLDEVERCLERTHPAIEARAALEDAENQ